MLTLALTRPRLRWVEQLTGDASSSRVWVERGLTCFSFAMGGYAWTCLFIVLHKQLGAAFDAMLRGAAYFMIAYAWLVHFEPFVAEWRLRGGRAAAVLYTGVATFAASVGVVIAQIQLTSPSLANIRFLAITGSVAAGGWVAYRGLPRIEALMDRAVATRERSPGPRDANETLANAESRPH